MPVLTNPRWELFAQELAKGKAASDAYKTAGFRPNRHNACVLKQKQTIIDRVSELLTERDIQHAKATEKAVEKLAIDREWVMAGLIEDRLAARAVGQLASSIRALELLGKELGMFIHRKDITTRVEQMTDAELEASIARFLVERDDDGADGEGPQSTEH